MSIPIAPLPVRERDLTLDALRGFALFGILVMNLPTWSYTVWMHQRGEDVWPGLVDTVALATSRYLFSGKFNALFSMLFGIGFALQLERLKDGGERIYLRRLFVLGVIGVMHHAFVWYGDVLFLYARIGLFLLLLRRANVRTLAACAVVCWAVGPLGYFVRVRFFGEGLAREIASYEDILRAFHAAATGGSYLDGVRARWAHFVDTYSSPWFLLGDAEMLCTALLGCVVGRLRLWKTMAQRRKQYVAAGVTSAGLGLAAAIGWNLIRPHLRPGKPGLLNAWVELLYDVQRPAFLVAYAIGLGLLAASPKARTFAEWPASAGRMPLTNYLAQSVVGTWVFYGYGLGFYGKVSPAWGLVYCVLFYAAQVVISRGYSKRKEYGPVEYLWRRLTYGTPRTAPEGNSLSSA